MMIGPSSLIRVNQGTFQHKLNIYFTCWIYYLSEPRVNCFWFSVHKATWKCSIWQEKRFFFTRKSWKALYRQEESILLLLEIFILKSYTENHLSETTLWFIHSKLSVFSRLSKTIKHMNFPSTAGNCRCNSFTFIVYSLIVKST